ncbi:unnamed protein product [Somion occarium]|uniref:Uncharacterized protein n=1 Tax=Somion occarium TaxID=3059160 RepID=A0ABP1E351_9APHY
MDSRSSTHSHHVCSRPLTGLFVTDKLSVCIGLVYTKMFDRSYCHGFFHRLCAATYRYTGNLCTKRSCMYTLLYLNILCATPVSISIYLIQFSSDVDKVIIICILYGGIAVVGIFVTSLPPGPPREKRIWDYNISCASFRRTIKVVKKIGNVVGFAVGFYIFFIALPVPLFHVRDWLNQHKHGMECLSRREYVQGK